MLGDLSLNPVEAQGACNRRCVVAEEFALGNQACALASLTGDTRVLSRSTDRMTKSCSGMQRGHIVKTDRSRAAQEALLALNCLAEKLRPTLDGRETILRLRDVGRNWRQMEWIGFGFEFLAKSLLESHQGFGDGPTFGRTEFDLQRDFVWDLKAHPSGSTGRSQAILNDQEAVDLCIVEYGSVGFILACGSASYDVDGEFKRWHDELKGSVSAYEQQRIARGAPSRRRKTNFSIESYIALWLGSAAEIRTAQDAGWLGVFAQGRNSNGLPRRPKYVIKDVAAAIEGPSLIAALRVNRHGEDSSSWDVAAET